jgi:putative aldouronate transport system substrate-binding protein
MSARSSSLVRALLQGRISRRQFLKRAVAAGISLSAAGALLQACGGSDNEGGQGASGQTTLKPPFRATATPNAPEAPEDPQAASTGGTVPEPPGYELPIVEPGSVTFTYAGPDNGYAPRSFTQDLAVWEEIEKRTGVEIEWDVAAGEQYNQSMPARLGSGKNLPDMLSLPEGWDPVRAGEEGLVVPLNDHINEENTPNIVRYFEEFPEIRKLLTAPDGNIYAFSSDVTDSGYSDPGYVIIVREDWLRKLDLEEPETLDDWYKVLKAFKTQDPNGNGEADEIPLLGSGGNFNSLMGTFGTALGLHIQYSQGWYVDDSGKVYYEWTDPRVREMVIWLNKLHEEKLLDPQFYESDHENRLQKVTRDLAGADADFSNRTVEWTRAQVQAGQSEASWVAAAPPNSDRVEQRYYEMYGPLSGFQSVTKDCKDPALAVKWLDYIWASDEGNTLVSYGMEGLTYEVNEDEELRFKEWVTDNPDGLDPNSALRYHGALPYATPWIRAVRGPLSEFSWDVTRTEPKWLKTVEKVASYMARAFPLILATSEETEELAGITTDMETYREETLVKFVLGQQQINDETWEEYVSTMEGLGLDRVIEIKQQQYDRYTESGQ